MTISIIGAGLSGLIAARMLQDRKPVIFERQPELPNNHHAVLRFRTEAVSHATNIPFKKVHVLKAIHGSENPVSDAVRYSRKVTGRIEARSIIDTAPVERFTAPADFIPRLAATADISFGADAKVHAIYKKGWKGVPIISTIPMPALMELTGYPNELRPNFEYRSGWTARAELRPEVPADLYATVYFPNYNVPWYRVSVTGRTLMVEGVGDVIGVGLDSSGLLSSIGLATEDFPCPLIDAHPAKYQKLGIPSFEDREKMKRFILWATQEFNIYSLGRFATWRPGLLLDDLVNDVRVIERLINGAAPYQTHV